MISTSNQNESQAQFIQVDKPYHIVIVESGDTLKNFRDKLQTIEEKLFITRNRISNFDEEEDYEKLIIRIEKCKILVPLK